MGFTGDFCITLEGVDDYQSFAINYITVSLLLTSWQWHTHLILPVEQASFYRTVGININSANRFTNLGTSHHRRKSINNYINLMNNIRILCFTRGSCRIFYNYLGMWICRKEHFNGTTIVLRWLCSYLIAAITRYNWSFWWFFDFTESDLRFERFFSTDVYVIRAFSFRRSYFWHHNRCTKSATAQGDHGFMRFIQFFVFKDISVCFFFPYLRSTKRNQSCMWYGNQCTGWKYNEIIIHAKA